MRANSDNRRLFFALWPSDSVRARMEHATHELAARSRGRVVSVGNLHVTLAFVGAVPHARVDAVLQAGKQISGLPFDLRLDQIESWRGSHLLCLTSAQTPPALAALVDDLRGKLRAQQFNLRNEEFRPHVTLARDMPQAQPSTSIAPLIWRVDDFALVESELDKSGSVYTVVRRWPLVESY